MTKTAMPEPFTYPPDDWVKGFFDEPNECGFYSFYGDFGNIAYRFQRAAQFNHLITTDQAEAYANARVREALELAEAGITDLMSKQTSVRAADAIAAIRALIPE